MAHTVLVTHICTEFGVVEFISVNYLFPHGFDLALHCFLLTHENKFSALLFLCNRCSLHEDNVEKLCFLNYI